MRLSEFQMIQKHFDEKIPLIRFIQIFPANVKSKPEKWTP